MKITSCTVQPKKLVTPDLKPNLTSENIYCGLQYNSYEGTVDQEIRPLCVRLDRMYKIWTGYFRHNNTHFSDGKNFIRLEPTSFADSSYGGGVFRSELVLDIAYRDTIRMRSKSLKQQETKPSWI